MKEIRAHLTTNDSVRHIVNHPVMALGSVLVRMPRGGSNTLFSFGKTIHDRMNTMKKLIAYYSRAGNNMVGADIVNLPVGNTEVAAKMIQKMTGFDIFRIDTVKAYPADYHETTDVAKQELRENARPELSDQVANMADYRVIYLGYPNWWGTMPMAVFTFLESYDFAGKTIVPFCTHEGSGMGHSENDIRKLCSDARVMKGLPIRGGSVQGAENDIESWLRKLGEIE